MQKTSPEHQVSMQQLIEAGKQVASAEKFTPAQASSLLAGAFLGVVLVTLLTTWSLATPFLVISGFIAVVFFIKRSVDDQLQGNVVMLSNFMTAIANIFPEEKVSEDDQAL